MFSLAIFIAAVALAAATGAQFAPGTWYEALIKPAWTPPNWLFGPVWTVLYIAIAAAGWLVWRGARGRFSSAMVLWTAQLLFNAAWSWLFFGLHRPGLALIDIVLMLGAILCFIVAARPVSRLASWLFAPYAVWVVFATALNAYVWYYNPIPQG